MSAPASAPLLIVGGGKMGGAIAQGAVAHGRKAADIHIIEPHADHAARLKAQGFSVMADLNGLPAHVTPGVILLAVKPQVMAEALPPYARFAGRSLFVSIAAGKTLEFLARHLGPRAAIVRAMPNTPAAIGKGITVAIANRTVTPDQKAAGQALLSAVGECVWIEEEGLMDAVTAVSGSGPAYVFLLMETMARAGMAQGLSPDIALRLARATVWGAGALAQESGEDPARLRENVTSPGGTTAAALSVLMGDPGLQDLMDRAIAAAVQRGRELA